MKVLLPVFLILGAAASASAAPLPLKYWSGGSHHRSYQEGYRHQVGDVVRMYWRDTFWRVRVIKKWRDGLGRNYYHVRPANADGRTEGFWEVEELVLDYRPRRRP